MTGSALYARITPKITPSVTPTQPITSPCDMNTPTIRRGEAPKRAQNGDVRSLVRDDHHQHRHDAEGGHRDYEHQDDAHHPLLDADGAEVVGVILRPVDDFEGRRQRLAHLRRKLRAASASSNRTRRPSLPAAIGRIDSRSDITSIES